MVHWEVIGHTVLNLDSCWNLTGGNRKTHIKIGPSWALSELGADKREYTKQELPLIPAEELRMSGMGERILGCGREAQTEECNTKWPRHLDSLGLHS